MLFLPPDARRALADREAAPLAPPGYDCCGCTAGATVATPDGLCDDCGPRYADAGEHFTACRCAECQWWHEVNLRREARSEDAEVCL